MVKQIGSVAPRSTSTVNLETSLHADGIIRPPANEQRTTYRFISTLDEHVEIVTTGTDSTDEAFSYSSLIDGTIPVPPGSVRDFEYTGPFEYLRFDVTAQTAPTEGELVCVALQDNGPPSERASLVLDTDISQGKSYLVSEHEDLLTDGSTSIGIRNPGGNDKAIILSQTEFDVTGNATTEFEIDHESYTDGTAVKPLNRKPSLQIESPFEGEVSLNPTVSNPQETTNGVIPGGTKSAGSGNIAQSVSFVLAPGQDIVMRLTNISGGQNRFGFTLGLVEKSL